MEGKGQQAAAAASGMSVRTARTWQRGRLPSGKKGKRRWRTRPDPFAEIWAKEVEPLLRSDVEGALKATTILEWLDERHPGRFSVSQLRTLQRRLRDWRALSGPDREVYFEQAHPPGREAQMDFTHCGELGVTVSGEPFGHLLFHFVLSHSGWRYVDLAYGETFAALVKGMQGALWELGGVPEVLRTDNLSAATHELKGSGGRALNERYAGGAGALRAAVYEDEPAVIPRERRGRAGSPPAQGRARPGADPARQPGLPVGGSVHLVRPAGGRQAQQVGRGEAGA